MANDQNASPTRASAGVHDGATPPGGGRQDHNAMAAAAMRPASAGGASDTLAASGGLEVPGATGPQATGTSSGNPLLDTAAAVTAEPVPTPERFPGEREPDTMMRTDSGIMGGPGFTTQGGSPPDRSGLDQESERERAREGGGAPGQRKTHRH